MQDKGEYAGRNWERTGDPDGTLNAQRSTLNAQLSMAWNRQEEAEWRAQVVSAYGAFAPGAAAAPAVLYG